MTARRIGGGQKLREHGVKRIREIRRGVLPVVVVAVNGNQPRPVTPDLRVRLQIVSPIGGQFFQGQHAAVGGGLYLIGVPNAILWGILATTLRFIPYIGPWLAAAMPIGLSMAISGDWVAPSLTIGLFLILELFTNNFLEPWLYGKNTGVSAVAVLLAAVFWTWLKSFFCSTASARSALSK